MSSRREFLQCAAILAAGLTSAPRGWSMTEEQLAIIHENHDFLDSHTASLFDTEQRASIAAVARQIIPTTDTPGADEANVAQFIELMVQHWFNKEERAQFLNGLDSIADIDGQSFDALSPSQQLDHLEALEDLANGSSWYDTGNTLRTWDSEAPFICQIKELTVLGFILSEAGSTEFLSPNPMGRFDGEVPIDDDTRAHATQIPLRVFSKAL